jgi:hypothetical protein
MCNQTGNETSDTFFIYKGLRQGDALACKLFSLALEKTVRDANVWTRGTIYKSTQLLAYADGIDIVGRTLTAVSEALVKMEKAASRWD